MLRVGLTGGYATGKSFVASEMERRGCHVIYADRLGHRVLERGGEAFEPVVSLYGTDILNPETGEIDRKALGQLVFGAPDKLQQLSSIVHPAVYRLEEKMFREAAESDPGGVAVFEAAILIEHDRQGAFDRLILTNCDPGTQIRRGMRRDHLTQQEVERRIAVQLPFEQKRKWANYVVDTSGTKEETVHQVEEIVKDLKRQAQQR